MHVWINPEEVPSTNDPRWEDLGLKAISSEPETLQDRGTTDRYRNGVRHLLSRGRGHQK
jgi:hypothetical protein